MDKCEVSENAGSL